MQGLLSLIPPSMNVPWPGILWGVKYLLLSDVSQSATTCSTHQGAADVHRALSHPVSIESLIAREGAHASFMRISSVASFERKTRYVDISVHALPSYVGAAPL